jgi:TP901 family phage tail tape measure protein
MARMSLDTAIRLSAEVKGGGNIDRVKRSLQDLAKGGQTTARDMGTLRAATFQYARANDSTIGGIRNSITAFRGLQEQAKIGSREFQRYGAEIQKLEGKLRGLDGTATKAGQSLGSKLAAGLAAAGIGRALQGITMQAANFEGELRKAAAIEGGAGAMAVLRKEIESVAAVAAGTPTEVAALATALSRAGFSADETAKSLRGIVLGAEATDTAFDRMGGIAATVLNTFGLQASDTARVIDVMVKSANSANQNIEDLGEALSYSGSVASSLGVSVEDLSGVIGLLADAGIRSSRAGTTLSTGLNRLQIAAGGADSEVQNLTRGNVKLAEAMKRLGAEVLDAQGRLRPMDQVLVSLRRQMVRLSTTDRAILAKALFGEEAGRSFLALLNRSEKEITSMIRGVNNAGGTAQETREKMRGFGDSVKVLGGNIENVTNQIGGMIGTALKPLIDGLNAALGAAAKLPEPIKNIGAAAAAAGIATLGWVVAINALKTALAVVGGVKLATAAITGYAGAATAAGTASAIATPKVAALLGMLTRLSKIGLIVIGVKFAVEGLDDLITGLVGVRDAEAAGRAMAERRGLTYVPSEAVRRRRAGSDYVSRFAGARDEAFARARMITGAPGAAVPLAVQSAGGGAAGGGSGGSAATQKAAESIGAQIAKSLQQALNLTPAQAAGVVGNLMRESGLNPRINEGGAVGLPRGVGGYGLAQWTGSRQSDLVRFAGGAAAAGNLQTQLRFMVSELLGPESRALASLRRTTTPEEAAVVFDRDYERSGIKALGERKANARSVYQEIAGTGPGAGLQDFASQLRDEAQAAEQLAKQQEEMKKRIGETFDARRKSTDQVNKEVELLRATSDVERLKIEHAYESAEILDRYKQAREDILKLEQESLAVGVESNLKELLGTIDLEEKAQLANATLRLERELNKIYEERAQKYTGSLKEQNQELQNSIDDLRLRNRLTMEGVSESVIEGELRKADAYRQQAEALRQIQIEIDNAKNNDDKNDAIAVQKKINEEYARQVELIDQATAAQTEQGVALGLYIGQLKQQMAELTNIENQIITMAGTIEQELSGAISSAVSGLVAGTGTIQQSLGEMFKSIGQSFMKMAADIIAKQLAMIALNKVLGIFGSAIAPGGFGVGQSFGFGAAAAMPSFDVPSVLPRAIGGPVSAGRAYKRNENGPELFVPYQSGTIIPADVTEQLAAANLESIRRLPISPQGNNASNLSVPFQGQSGALAVPFMRGSSSDTSAGPAGAADGVIRFESVVINNQEFVTREEAEKIGRRSEQRGAALAQRRLVNNPTVRRATGLA